MKFKKGKDGYYRYNRKYKGVQIDLKSLSEPDLEQKIFARKMAIENGEVVLCGNTTVRKWAEEWLGIYKKPSLSKSNYSGYDSNLNNHILPYIGDMRIMDIKPINIQNVLNELEGKSHSLISKVDTILRQMFKKAKSNHLINVNPYEDISKPKYTKGTHRSITEFEREHILKVAENHHAGLWVKMMLYCGLRPGETAALLWKDIDFENKTVKINKAIESGSRNIKAPKTDAGIREIPISDIFLRDLQSAYSIDKIFQAVFLTKQKYMLNSKSMQRWWNYFKNKVDISMGATIKQNQIIISVVADDLTPYCLRHTYCTDLQDAGVPLNVAKYLMGHRDIRVTANIYTHTTNKSIKAATAKINNYQSGKKNATKKYKFRRTLRA